MQQEMVIVIKSITCCLKNIEKLKKKKSAQG